MSAVGSSPDVTVVVATYQRSHLLEDLVASLLAQETDLEHEVVVVDNGSTDDSAQVLADLVDRDSTGRLRVRRIESNHGPARARNLGIREARGRVVAFTDDDCVATPTWVQRIAAPILDGVVDVVQGRTTPRPDQADRTGPWARSQTIPCITGFYETCNIAYRRTVLVELDGFSEDFPVAAGEDTDLGLRAIAAGARVLFGTDAVVHHEVWPLRFRQALADRTRTGELPMLVRLHPELRRQLPARVFWRRGHAKVLAALGVATVAGAAIRPLAGAAVATGWVLARATRARGGIPGRRDVALSAQRCIADGWEVAVTIGGSLRHRTLLL